MNRVTGTYEYNVSQIESIFIQLSFILKNVKPKITEGQQYFLAYLYLFPDNFKERLVEDNRFLSAGAVAGAQSLLSSRGLIETTGVKLESVSRKANQYRIVQPLSNALVQGDMNCLIKINVQ